MFIYVNDVLSNILMRKHLYRITQKRGTDVTAVNRSDALKNVSGESLDTFRIASQSNGFTVAGLYGSLAGTRARAAQSIDSRLFAMKADLACNKKKNKST